MRKRNLSLIFALSRNNVLGKGGTIPWRSPEDLRWFKFVTLSGAVIMGRKTWESLPPNMRPLPDRDNYVVTRNPEYTAEGATVVLSLEQAIQDVEQKNPGKMMYVIGGKALLEEAGLLAYRIYISEVDVTVPIDDTCVMGPSLPDYDHIIDSKLVGQRAGNPAVRVGTFVFRE